MVTTAPAGQMVAPRVLVVSADIGGGHDATGRALEEQARHCWPDGVVRWVDTLDAMGRWVGPAFRRTYVTNVESTPRLYEFFYSQLWRQRWFATACKRFVGAWAGRALIPVLAEFNPHLVLSTYPLGSAGLAWLRRRRGLSVPIGAWISDFAPHPFWVYRELDLNLVVHPWAAATALAAAPGAPVAWCRPPVTDRFRAVDRTAARRRFDLPPEEYAVVVSCGSLGFGAVVEAAGVLAGLGDPIRVLVTCGRNRAMAKRVADLGFPQDRVRALDWVDDMPSLLRAADLVVTNAGGATALEAMVTETPLLMYRPIAAHGAANAALMAACGVAEVCHTPGGLAANVRSRMAGRRARRPPSAGSVPPPVPDLGVPLVAALNAGPRAGASAWIRRALQAPRAR